MSQQMKYLTEIEPAKPAQDGRPLTGPVYRSIFAKDGLLQPPKGMETCWDIFRISEEKHPMNPMLGRREIQNGKAGKYVWLSYMEVYDIVMQLGNSICSSGFEQGTRCAIYGTNSPQWIMSMEACNAHGMYCVPLYDTLALVSFGKVTPEQREEVGKIRLSICTWEEFLKLGADKQYELPQKKKTDICTIMYTSGTTGDPKGVLMSNESIIALIAGVKKFLESANVELTEKDIYMSYLPLAHIFDRVVEEFFISLAA